MNQVDDLKIKNRIYEVRVKHVIFDRDLARLYGTHTKRINEAAKNNSDKFTERFSFILDNIESNIF